jgi:hypothetical protein
MAFQRSGGGTMLDQLFQSAFRAELSETRLEKPSVLWAAGTSLILFLSLVFALTTVWFVIGGVISPGFGRIILIACAALSLYISSILFPGTSRVAPFLALGLGLLAALAASLFRDTSIDGQHYHFQAIYALAEGWNPVHKMAPPPMVGDAITPWAIHYPRGVWVFSATLLAAGLPLAVVKIANLLVLFAAGAIVGSTLYRAGFSALFALVLTSAAVLNPVILSQAWTSMNDGLLGHCILIFAASTLTWIRHDERGALAAGLATMVLALNLKFSAIPIYVILCVSVCAGAYLVHRLPKALAAAAILFMSAATAIFVLGWSPYMQNFLDHGHVFHPIMGKDAIEIMVGNTPAYDNTPQVLLNRSAAERFFFSLFSETHGGFDTVARLKVPFTVSPEELRAAGGVDVRLAGFGPFFSGGVLLALATTILLTVRWKECGPVARGLLFVAGALFLSVILMPQNWWARYVPQFWFVPVCVAAAALTMNKRPAQILGASILAAMLAGSMVVGGASTWLTAKRSAEASAQLARLADTGQRYCVNPDMVESRIFLMQSAGIEAVYTPVEAIVCDAPEAFDGYGPDRVGGLICACPD